MLCLAVQIRRPSMNHLRSVRRMLAALLLVSLGGVSRAEQYPDHMFQGLRWRLIGPHRGGRTRAATGVPSQPNVFYMGQVDGGVWKSDDYGRTWTPIFDQEPTQSIGAIAVAPSDPNIIYVATGEGLQRPDLSVGDGITNPPMQAKPGRILAWTIARVFQAWLSTRAIPTASSQRCLDI